MPQIGRYYVPQFRLMSLVPTVKQIYDKFQSGEAESDLLAQLLGYASRESGTFYARIKDLTSYGLIIQTGRGKFRVTDLGKRISYPKTREEGDLAMKDVFLTIAIWNDMYKKFGNNVPQDLWVDIAQMAGIEPPKAKEVQDLIRNAYLDDLSKIPPTILSGDQKSFMQQEHTEKQTMSQTLEAPLIAKPDSAKITLNVGGKSYQLEIDDKDSMEASMAILNLLGKKVGVKINTEDIPSKAE